MGILAQLVICSVIALGSLFAALWYCTSRRDH